MSQRLIAIGDIHGHKEKLEQLVELIKPDEDTKIIILGDFVDRGPDSKGVIDLLLDFRKSVDCQVLLGNHETFLLGWHDGNVASAVMALRNGGTQTLLSYGFEEGDIDMFQLPPAHEEFLRSLPVSIETEHHFFCHAGVRPGVPLDAQTEHDLLWIREPFISSGYDWGKIIVCGHSPVAEPVVKPNMIRLDTGATHSRESGYGHLTACDVLRGNFWRTP